MGRNHEGSNRDKRSEQYEGDTEREDEKDPKKSWNEEGGQDHPAAYKKVAKTVKHAEDTEGENFKHVNNGQYTGHYLPYAQRAELYDKVTDGDPDESGKNYYMEKIGPARTTLSKLAKSRRSE